jgi:hypothetical protein
MKTRSSTLLLLASAAALMTFACLGSAAATPTSLPAQATEVSHPPTEPVLIKEGDVEILNSTSYTDHFNDFYVVGELVNNTNQTIENVTLSLSITDEAGASLLKDENENPVDRIDIHPYIGVFSPGVSAPFSYYISPDEAQPANYEISVKSYDPSSAAKLKEFDVQKVQTNFMDNGDVILTGEVVNMSSVQMDVESLAGAVLDEAGNVLAANSTVTYSRYLYPAGDPDGRDRGPFAVTLFGPIENVSQWKIYVRSLENTSVPSADLGIELAGSYVDLLGTYHLVGTVTNNGSSQISPSVIGGLYGSDKAVLDAASSNIPLYLNAGESAPFDLSSFSVVPYMSPEQISPAKEIVLPDLYWSYATDYEVVSLEAQDVSVTKEDSDWKITGTAVNTTDKNLSSISVVVEFLDENGQVMATNSTALYPAEGSEVIQPGDSNEFSLFIYAPAEWDLSSQEYQVTLQGVVSQ